jgi:hypothetical protein
MYRASRWADEARSTTASVFWNVWVLLALPGVWLAWSMVAFLVSIMAFVWRTGAKDDPDPDTGTGTGTERELSGAKMLGPRIAISAVFAIGIVYFVLVIFTFKRYSAGRPRRTQHRREATDPGYEMSFAAVVNNNERNDGEAARRSNNIAQDSVEVERGRGSSRYGRKLNTKASDGDGRSVVQPVMGLGLTGIGDEKLSRTKMDETEKDATNQARDVNDSSRPSGSTSPGLT